MKKECDFCDNMIEIKMAINSVGGNEVIGYGIDVKCKNCGNINTLRKINPEALKAKTKEFGNVMNRDNMFG